jgi:hypothetical protein
MMVYNNSQLELSVLWECFTIQDTIAALGDVFNFESAIFCYPLQNDGKYQGY